MSKRDEREYRIWKAMKSRCKSPSCSDMNYQKKNITVCQEWINSYESFLSDMGRAPSNKHSIDRIDNDLGYCKENCRWATQKVQCSNRGSFNKVFEYNGISMILKDWAVHFGIKYTTLYLRIYRSGLSFEKAIEKDPFNRLVELNGEKRILKDWCKLLGRKYQTVVCRIHDGWEIKRALLTETHNDRKI